MTIITVHTDEGAQRVREFESSDDRELVVDLRHLSPDMRALIDSACGADAWAYLETAAAHCATITSREAFLA